MAVNEISPRNWYAAYTRSKFENKVCKILDKKRITYFYPKENRDSLQWYGSHHESIPLFHSYVFVYINEPEKQVVSRTDGVLNFVHWLCEPVVIPNQEIAVIRNVVDNYTGIHVEKTNIRLQNTDSEIYNGFPVSNGFLNLSNSFLNDHNPELVRFSLPSLGYILEAIPKKEEEKAVQAPVPVLKFFHSERLQSAFNSH